MLKESAQFEYVEIHEAKDVSFADHLPPRFHESIPPHRRGKLRGPKLRALPCGSTITEQAAHVPLQSYLAERFSHIGGHDQRFRYLRAENQRRHDRIADLGRLPMSRAS